MFEGIRKKISPGSRERLVGLDDVLEDLVEKGIKPDLDTLYNAYRDGLSVEGKTALDFEYGESIVKAQIEEFIARLPRIVKAKSEVLDAETFLSLKIPEPDYQVRGLMIEKGITILAGYQSTFKTHTALYMALCLANGSSLFDRFECKKCKVLYVNEEMNESMFQKAIRDMSQGCGLPITKEFFIMNFKGWKIDNPEDNAKYVKIITDNGIKLVIFDTFRECFKAAENSADEINALFTNYLRPIVEKTGCSFLIILHKGKATAGSESRQSVDLIRGSSMFRNYVDSIILMDRLRKTLRVMLSHEKMRGSQEVEDFNIIWEFESGRTRPRALTEDELERVLIDDCKKDLLDFAAKEDLQEIKTGSDTAVYKRFIESKKYSNGTFYAALRELKDEGKIKPIKRGSYEVIDKRLNDF